MKFFLDENIPFSVTNVINKLNFKAEHTINVGLRGATDKEIANYAKKTKAILITKDLDFGSTLSYSKDSHYGVLILRLPSYFNTKQISNALKDFLEKIDSKILIGSITILEIGKYRTRHL